MGSAIALVVLLAFAASLAEASPSSPLLEAARAGDAKAVTELLAAGADPDEAGQEGVAALHIAAAAGYTEVVVALLKGGAFVDSMEFDGDTPLINASALGHVDIARLLIDAGADIETLSSRGFTPIQHARRGRHSAIVRLLRDSAKSPAGGMAQATNRPAENGSSSTPGGRPRALPSSNNRSSGEARQTATRKTYQAGYQRRIAAVIGVNDYAHWPALTGARPDAEKIAAQLRGQGFDEILELYDRDATRSAILELLGSRLAAKVNDDDLVMIFFAGHGQTETIGGEFGTKRGYIIPSDATIEGVFSTAIPMQQLRDLTNRLAAKHVYYAMDSCYSGLGFTRGLGIIKPGVDDYIDKVTSLRSVQMVTAGGEGEEAIEENGEGIFTRSLLDALDGKADANGDGWVTATEIGAYVAPRVTIETGARQSPQSGRLEGEGEIAFQIRARR